MKSKSILLSELFVNSRWDVSYFTNDVEGNSSNFPLVKLRTILKERKAGMEPSRYPEHIFNYVGLENISSRSRLLVNFEPKKGSLIKSRSKIFRNGDILYGRMRPTLNKVLKIDESLTEGICSNEIFVLTIVSNKVNSIYVEEILTSEWMQRQIIRLIGGATMPRISISDFMDIEVPLPPLDIQNDISKIIASRREIWINKLNDVENEPKIIDRSIELFISSGFFDILSLTTRNLKWINRLPDTEIC